MSQRDGLAKFIYIKKADCFKVFKSLGQENGKPGTFSAESKKAHPLTNGNIQTIQKPSWGGSLLGCR